MSLSIVVVAKGMLKSKFLTVNHQYHDFTIIINQDR